MITVVEVAWAAVGLLGVAMLGMFGMFLYLGSKIDQARDSLGARIDGLAARLDVHIDHHAG